MSQAQQCKTHHVQRRLDSSWISGGWNKLRSPVWMTKPSLLIFMEKAPIIYLHFKKLAERRVPGEVQVEHLPLRGIGGERLVPPWKTLFPEGQKNVFSSVLTSLLRLSRGSLGSGKRIDGFSDYFWSHTSGPIKTRYVKQGQFFFPQRTGWSPQ